MLVLVAAVVGLCAVPLPARYDGLLTWLRSAGAELGPVSLRPSLSGDGAGLFATRDVAVGELLFSVPARAQLDGDTARAALGGAALGGGTALTSVAGSPYDTAVIAGVLALVHLAPGAGPELDWFAPYVATLPMDERGHVLWWSEAELRLLEGTAALNEARQLHADVRFAEEVVCADEALGALVAGALGVGADEAGAAIADAVRGAYVCMLSRSFGVAGDVEDRELIPLLDMLQHAPRAAVEYKDRRMGGGRRIGPAEPEPAEASRAALNIHHVRFEPTVWAGDEGCTEVRATSPIAAGTEVLNHYGDHPDFVFGTHFAFVDPSSDSAAAGLVLDGGERPGAGARVARSARAASAYLDEAESLEKWEAGPSWLRQRGGVASDDPFDGLSSLLAAAGPALLEPLGFIVSERMLVDAEADVADGRRPQRSAAMDGLLTCARVCALDAHDLREARARAAPRFGARFGRRGAPRAEDAPPPDEELVLLAVGQMLRSRSGSLSERNDRNAAALLVEAAGEQARALERAPGPGAPSAGVRAECRELAGSLRKAELRALHRLRDAPAGALWAGAARAACA